MRPQHLMTRYQKVTILLCKKYSNIDDWILQISLRFFGSHNIRNFYKKTPKYKLRNCRVTLLQNPKIKKYGTDTIAYKAAQLWSTLPRRYKYLQSLDLFKSEIKNSICRIVVNGIGFIIWN